MATWYGRRWPLDRVDVHQLRADRRYLVVASGRPPDCGRLAPGRRRLDAVALTDGTL